MKWLAITSLDRKLLTEVREILKSHFDIPDISKHCAGLIKSVGSEEIPFGVIYQTEMLLDKHIASEQVLLCDWCLVTTWEYWVQLPVPLYLIVLLAEPEEGLSQSFYLGLGRALNYLGDHDFLICFQTFTSEDLQSRGWRCPDFTLSFQPLKSKEIRKYFSWLQRKRL